MTLIILSIQEISKKKSMQRVNATFTMNVCPSEQNIIVFDDFVTTGQTMLSMKRLFQPTDKNLVYIAGIRRQAKRSCAEGVGVSEW